MRFAPFYIHFVILLTFFFSALYVLKNKNIFTFQFNESLMALLRKFVMQFGILTFLSMLLLYTFPSYMQTEKGFQFVFVLNLTYCYFWIPLSIFAFFVFIQSKTKSRRNIPIYIGLCFSFLFIFMVIYGVNWGRKNYQVSNTIIHTPSLPPAFEGLKIVQISDLHLGSLNYDTAEVNKYVKLINKQQADLICFTGDLVNCRAEEIRPFINTLKQLKSKLGNFAVLGNHDFGEFYPWKTKTEKLKNDSLWLELTRKAGFTVLQDENRCLRIGHDSISLIGIRNWSKPPFPSKGDFEKAAKGTDAYAFKILLSHDPTHWQRKIKGQKQVDLTLSGHTHGGQIGFTWNKHKYSAATFMIPYCGGIYQVGNQYLYVSVGLGFVGLPLRFNMPPEISVIELSRKRPTGCY